ncbi:MAG: NAD(P)H-dependent glycerol-3-phosphate dehydrogenase [Holosporales bacterium]|jgi:glycerol-3-phosphate dehydrogenase (NAD(P)+)|nr:NAD(P)H-dependent glycerol-3-phosphate dehydrogenase [Holosporales bacterium]
MNIAIIGAGSYGTALAQVLSRKHCVRLYNDMEGVVDEINKKHTNRGFLGDIHLNPDITASTDISTVGSNHVLIIAVPAQAVRDLCSQIRELVPGSLPIVSCSKGIERTTGMFMSEIICQQIKSPVFVLSGPSFAAEISRNMPTSVNLAGEDRYATEDLAEKLSTETFSLAPTENLIGIQACGAFKNVLAIIIGIIRGLGLGNGAESVALTKGIQEISNFIRKVTGNSNIVQSLSGIGDIVMTCFSPTSRNYTLGVKIAKKEISLPLENSDLSGIPLSEGALTIKSWPQVINRFEKDCQICADMPLFGAVYSLLYETLSLSGFVSQAI